MNNIPDLLERTSHRPFPLPESPWVMRQSWRNLLFAHWPVKPKILREYIPPVFDMDTFDQSAWIGVVPFAMRHVCPRKGFEIPFLSNFLELNIRTYVLKDGVPGVYFFSLDCSNPIAVALARKFYYLPYFDAQMKLEKKDRKYTYFSRRRSTGAEFHAIYKPSGPVFTSVPGSIEHFLTERYCLYTTDPNGAAYRGVIHHDQWRLQPAEAEIRADELVYSQIKANLPKVAPLVHYSKKLDTIEWALEPLS